MGKIFIVLVVALFAFGGCKDSKKEPIKIENPDINQSAILEGFKGVGNNQMTLEDDFKKDSVISYFIENGFPEDQLYIIALEDKNDNTRLFYAAEVEGKLIEILDSTWVNLYDFLNENKLFASAYLRISEGKWQVISKRANEMKRDGKGWRKIVLEAEYSGWLNYIKLPYKRRD